MVDFSRRFEEIRTLTPFAFRAVIVTLLALYKQGNKYTTINSFMCSLHSNIVGDKVPKNDIDWEELNNLSYIKMQSKSHHPPNLCFERIASKAATQKINKLNVNEMFQQVDFKEGEAVYEFLERFSFKTIADENDEQREALINMKNLLRLIKQYNRRELRLIVHATLYNTLKQEIRK